MNVASQELCKELYEVSGWETDRVWSMRPKDHEEGMIAEVARSQGFDINVKEEPKVCYRMGQKELAPAYDLGYLLRELPRFILASERAYWLELGPLDQDASWGANYTYYDREYADADDKYYAFGETPENATCKLAIKLFKDGVLGKA